MSEGLVDLHITGFGSLAEVRLQPGPLTLLIGPNGSGKSNVLLALRMVPLMRTGSLQRFVAAAGGASGLLYYGPKRTQALTIRLEFAHGEQRNSYEARLGYAAGDKLMYLDERVGYRPPSHSEMHHTSLGAGHWESELQGTKHQNTTARTVNHLISGLTFFHFHDTSLTSSLRSNARSEDDRHLRSDGSNLAAFLLRLAQSDNEADQKAWHRIGRCVSQVVPALKRLDPAPVHESGSAVRLDWIDQQDARFGVHQLSDGSLRAIALITALAQPISSLPKVISIDEPELGLHPAAIRLLADLARSVSRHTQVIFATQSTGFLDHFEPEEVVVAEWHDGATQLRRLEAEELASWLDDYTLAEVFDKGVIGGRP
jgi:predicted ATPase